MSDKRITKRDRYNALFAAIVESNTPDKEALCDFIAREIALLDKKSNTKAAPTAEQVENENIKASIASTLADSDAPMRSTEIALAIGISVQKCTALLRAMVLAGNATRHEDKKVVTFSL